MYFFTSDQHLGHKNIIELDKLPFESVEEMDETIISRYNERVGKNDVVVFGGDLTLGSKKQAEEYLSRLNGNKILLRGNHDKWMNASYRDIWSKTIDGMLITVCHYAMREWPGSYINSWQLYGHSHGTLPPIGKQWDIGVSNNDFYPLSLDEIREIMENRPDNPDLIPIDKLREGTSYHKYVKENK